MTVRSANPADIPAIASVIVRSVSGQAPWNSFFPSSLRNDPSVIAHVERIVRGYVEASENEWIVQVVEDEKDGRDVIASVAIWDTRAAPPAPSRSGSKTKDTYHGMCPFSKYLRFSLMSVMLTCVDAIVKVRDAPSWTDDWTIEGNEKVNTLLSMMDKARSKYFSGSGPQMYLRLLATAPDHQQRGCAKALCESGTEIAWQRQAAVCLLTGPRGYILVSGMGFSDLGAVSLPSSGGDEQVLKALTMDVSKAQKSHPGLWDSFWNYVRN